MESTSRYAWLAVITAGAVLIPASAAAEYPGDVAHKGRVSLDGQLGYWTGELVWPSGQNDFRVRTDSVGVFGYRRTPLGLGIGYALTERVVFGARVDFAMALSERGSTTIAETSTSGGPYLELLFMRDRAVRPFFIVRGGVGAGKTFEHDAGDGAEFDGVPGTTVFPTLGAGLGTHVFFSEIISFDAMLVVDYRWLFTNPDVATVDDEFNEINRLSPDGNGVIVSAILGFSRWF